MRSEHRFKAWNICDSGLNARSTGHHYWETRSLVDELTRRGERVRLFSHRVAPPTERFSGTDIVPTFSLSLWDIVSTDPAWATIENFVVHSRSFHSDLAGIEQSLFHDTLVLFPTLRENQLLGVLRWLADFPDDVRPRAALGLTEPSHWSETNYGARLYRTLWKGCPPALKNQIAIFARTQQAAEMFTKHIGMPTHVFPFIAPEGIFSTRPSSSGTISEPMTVSFVGGARWERGGALIADVVKRCAGSGVRFFIQAKGGESIDGPETGWPTAFSALPHVQLHEGVLVQADYYRAIADSVVLLAYDPRNYRWRDSGVYQEAKLLGAPVLVTAGTWMSDEVAALGNGLVVKNFSVDAIVECITQAQRELPALCAAAARVREGLHRTQGAARCIDAVAGAFERSDAPKP